MADKKIIISFSLDPKLIEKIDDIVNQRRMEEIKKKERVLSSRSQVTEELLIQGLKDNVSQAP